MYFFSYWDSVSKGAMVAMTLLLFRIQNWGSRFLEMFQKKPDNKVTVIRKSGYKYQPSTKSLGVKSFFVNSEN